MSWDVFERTRPLWRYARSVELSGNGEPLLNPLYLDMAGALKRARCFVHCYSNGLILSPSVSEALVTMGFDQIGVSMGGATSSTYRAVRGVDGFDTVIANLAALRDIKGRRRSAKPVIHFNIAAMNSVLRELPELILMASDLGVSAIDMFHLVAYYDDVRAESAWLDIDGARARMAEGLAVAKSVGIRLNLPSFERAEVFCPNPFSRFLVRWDGVVVSCVGHRFVLGDVMEKEPTAIWNDGPWVQFRDDIWQKGYGTLCPSCHTWQVNHVELLTNARPMGGEHTRDLTRQPA
jgi:MoaA/NifB/PqqE/SkfB family radical SAM enzyme